MTLQANNNARQAKAILVHVVTTFKSVRGPKLQ